MLRHHLAVGHIEDHQLFQPLGVRPGHPPGHGGAPIVPDQDHLFVTQGIDQPDDIGRQECLTRYERDPGWLFAQVVAALVRGDHPVTGRGKERDLVAPAVPELGKAVQEEDGRPGGRAGS